MTKPSYIGSLHRLTYTIARLTPGGVQMLGTCFMLNSGYHFATAAHVINNDERNLVILLSESRNLETYQEMAEGNLGAATAKIHAVDPFRDICILRVDSGNGAHLNIGGSDDVQVGDDLVIAGFPHCTEGRRVLTYQRTEVGAKVLMRSAEITSKHLIINIQTRPGQSGSPVLRAHDALLVGMVIGAWVPRNGVFANLGGVDPATLHQTTHAISSEYLHDMI